MVTLSTTLVILAFCLISVVFLWRFIRDRDWERLSTSALAPALKIHSAFMVPALLAILTLWVVNIEVGQIVLCFACGFFVPTLLSHSGMTAYLRSLLLLALALVATLLLPGEGYKLPWAGLMVGLILSKTIDVIALEKEPTLEDVLPAFLWLTGAYWTRTADTANWLHLHQQVILGALLVAVVVRWFQGPFLKEDKLYVKRLTFSAIGGLLLLIMVTKVFVAMEVTTLALVAGAGFFLTYVLEALDTGQDTPVLRAVKQLLFIGIVTLVVSRQFGMIGLMVLASTTIVAASPHAAALAGLFWGGRVLLQSFTFEFNTNMTGINVMHAYTSAALYGGFFLAIVLSILLVRSGSRLVSCLLTVTAAVVGPVSANFFLHAEPSAALLLSSLIACVLMSFLATPLSERESRNLEGIMLVPSLMVSVAILTNQLLETGKIVDSQIRIWVLIVIGFVASMVLFAASKLPSDPRKKPEHDPEIVSKGGTHKAIQLPLEPESSAEEKSEDSSG